MEQKTNNNGQNAQSKSNKTLWFSMLGALLLIILVVAAPRLKKDNSAEAPVDTDIENSTEVVSGQEVSAPTTPSKALSYADAVAKYGANRIQFDAECKANPSTLGIKKGTAVMLDNRSGKPRTIKIGNNTYAVSAYKYRTVTLLTPGAFPVACDTAQDVAAIIVEE